MSALDLSQDRNVIFSLGTMECPGCEGAKAARQSFCQRCYFTLPARQRSALYAHGPSYIPAFRDALKFLQASGKERAEAEPQLEFRIPKKL